MFQVESSESWEVDGATGRLVTKKREVGNEGLHVLAGKALEKRATIIVEANLITWSNTSIAFDINIYIGNDVTHIIDYFLYLSLLSALIKSLIHTIAL